MNLTLLIPSIIVVAFSACDESTEPSEPSNPYGAGAAFDTGGIHPSTGGSAPIGEPPPTGGTFSGAGRGPEPGTRSSSITDGAENTGGADNTGGIDNTGGTGGIDNTGGTANIGGIAGTGFSPSVGGTGTGGSEGGDAISDETGWPTDPKALVKSGNPGNAKLEAYADNQIGTPIIATEGTGTARTITQTIVVPPGVTYDGKGEKLTAEGMGDGSQSEDQLPYFLLMPGASIKNVTMTKPGCEGIHMMGDNQLDNIVWEDVGEDAASIRSYFPGGYIYIEGGSVHSAADKVFQLNAPSKIIIKNLKATNISKLIRQGDTTPIEVVLDGVKASNVKTALVMCNTSDCTLMTRDVSGSPRTKGPVDEIGWEEGASDRPAH
jgi:hypothetical protein